MPFKKENLMTRSLNALRHLGLLALCSLFWFPLHAGGHEAEAYSFAFHNFDSNDALPWSETPSWALYRDTFLAIPAEPDPLSSLFEYAFYENLYKTEIGKSGNCYGISLLSLLLHKKGAHLSVCGKPSSHSGDLFGNLVDKEGGMGLPDLFLGASDGTLRYFDEQTFPEAAVNPMDGVAFGSGTRPAFVNVDGDGDWDLFVSLANGTIRYFENVGSSKVPEFTERFGDDNPMNITGAAPLTLEFVDIDYDRDPDVFVAEGNGNIRYFKNIGSAIAPEYEEQIGAANPLDQAGVGTQAVIRFVDSDVDGDQDAYIGAADGTIHYFENQVGTFVSRTGDENPANAVVVAGNAAPIFADYNGDGVLDLFVGSLDGSISYYRNTGSVNNPHFSLQNGGANPMNAINTPGQAVPFLIDINDQDADDVVERSGPTDPLVRYTITRLQGHQVNLASLQYFSDYFLSGNSVDGRVAFNDFLDNQSKGVGTILSVTRNFEGDGAHAIVPYKAETKAASLNNALITTEVDKRTVTITGGADVFLGHHEGTVVTIANAGDGGDLASKIVRVLDSTTAVLEHAATHAVVDAAADWHVPERHLMYVYDCNFPYQNPNMRSWYEQNTNVVIIDAATGAWRYRKNMGDTVWPESPNGHITLIPENVTAPMGRTPVSMGLDVATLATQIVVHNDGAELVQVTDGSGKRMFIPGTRRLDLNPETGLRSIVPVMRFDGDQAHKKQVYLLWGKTPEELAFEVSGPNGYVLDVATSHQRVQVEADAIQGKDTLILDSAKKSTRLMGHDGATRYKMALTQLTKPGKQADTILLNDLTLGGTLSLTKGAQGDDFVVDTLAGSASYELLTEKRTSKDVKQQALGFQNQKPNTRLQLDAKSGMAPVPLEE